MPIHIQIKRVYDEPSDDDGYRVLVDRLWPRGVTKESLPVDRWCKELTPSTELRQWFDHRADRFEVFKEKYRKELEAAEKITREVLEAARGQTLTLLFAAKDQQVNHALILRDWLKEQADT